MAGAFPISIFSIEMCRTKADLNKPEPSPKPEVVVEIKTELEETEKEEMSESSTSVSDYFDWQGSISIPPSINESETDIEEDIDEMIYNDMKRRIEKRMIINYRRMMRYGKILAHLNDRERKRKATKPQRKIIKLKMIHLLDERGKLFWYLKNTDLYFELNGKIYK